jgi:oxygen-independent coproporphyrinogen-3 oxidase
MQSPCPLAPLALYVHWPFCRRKCPYCDYNSHVRENVAQEMWREALLKEFQYFRQFNAQQPITSIFFGGGTPSLMPFATLEAFLNTVASTGAGIAAAAEITLEANPSFLPDNFFKDLRATGVNRVSIGVQALNDTDLRFLGRDHSTQQAFRAIEGVAQHFDRYSFDLIFGRPQQTVALWEQELTQALATGVQHLSLYQLSIEEGTAFYTKAQRGEIVLPPDDTLAEMYLLNKQRCGEHGLEQYEISSYAARGQACQHNLHYWRYHDYMGVGAGAHGRLSLDSSQLKELRGLRSSAARALPLATYLCNSSGASGIDGIKTATAQARLPETWLSLVQTQGHGTATFTPLAVETQVEELIILGLRVHTGISHATFARVAGKTMQAYFSAETLEKLTQQGLLAIDAAGFRATAAGLLVLNYVEEQLLDSIMG